MISICIIVYFACIFLYKRERERERERESQYKTPRDTESYLGLK